MLNREQNTESRGNGWKVRRVCERSSNQIVTSLMRLEFRVDGWAKFVVNKFENDNRDATDRCDRQHAPQEPDCAQKVRI